MKGFPFYGRRKNNYYFLRVKHPIILIVITALLAGACSKQEDPPATEGKIIILMYHRIVKGDTDNLYERSEEDLESDLKYLKLNNIRIIDFHELNDYLSAGKMPPDNCAIITFDDGDYSWYSLARPLLLQYNMKATFFLWVHMIGTNSFLTWTEIEYMGNYTLDGGIRPFVFGSHTYSHPFLLGRKSSFATEEDYNRFLNYEMAVSKNIIEEHVPGRVDVLALPYGDGYGDQTIMTAAGRNGYRLIRTSKYGVIDNAGINMLMLPSLPILNDTPSDLIGVYLGL